MNTKRRKTGARLAAILLSLCLIVGLAARDCVGRRDRMGWPYESICESGIL